MELDQIVAEALDFDAEVIRNSEIQIPTDYDPFTVMRSMKLYYNGSGSASDVMLSVYESVNTKYRKDLNRALHHVSTGQVLKYAALYGGGIFAVRDALAYIFTGQVPFATPALLGSVGIVYAFSKALYKRGEGLDVIGSVVKCMQYDDLFWKDHLDENKGRYCSMVANNGLGISLFESDVYPEDAQQSVKELDSA